MLDGILQRLNDEGREMTFKELETTKNKVKPLVHLNLAEEVKIKITTTLPKTPNGIKLTNKGTLYITSVSNSEDINLQSQLNITLKEITDLRKGVEIQITESRATLDKLSKIEAALLILNQNVKVSTTDKKSLDIVSKLNLEVLRDSYLRHKGKGSPFAPLGKVIDEMCSNSVLSIADMKYELHELFLQKKILLRGGPSGESSQYRIQGGDGTEYAYLRVLY